MKRFHVHITVANLEESIRFYSKLFNSEPSVTKTDYAKWMLEDPRVNFAISNRARTPGVNHLGFQVDSAEELDQMKIQIEAADVSLLTQTGASCCYAKSDKHWVMDPTGIAWETFHSLGTVPVYGEDSQKNVEKAGACCIPLAPKAASPGTHETGKDACCVPLTGQGARKSKLTPVVKRHFQRFTDLCGQPLNQVTRCPLNGSLNLAFEIPS